MNGVLHAFSSVFVTVAINFQFFFFVLPSKILLLTSPLRKLGHNINQYISKWLPNMTNALDVINKEKGQKKLRRYSCVQAGKTS